MSAPVDVAADISILDVIAQVSPYSSKPHYYLLIDRMPECVYVRTGNALTAHDSGFYDFLGIAPGSTGAFGGREFDVTLSDGTKLHCQGQVWACSAPKDLEPTVDVGIGTIDTLRKCYVFSSASVSKAKLSAWLADNVPSTSYYKYDKRNTIEWLDQHWRDNGNPVCAQRARKLRHRGVTVWRDSEGRRAWSPHYERRKRAILDSVANDPGSISVAAALGLVGGAQ